MPAGSAPEFHRRVVAALLLAGLATACKQTHIVLDSVTDGGSDETGGTGGTGGGTSPGSTVTTVSAASVHTCAIAGGALYCWGANDYGQLGVGDTDTRPTPTRVDDGTDWRDVQVGERSSLGLKQDGSIWSFGANDVGQLGQGDFVQQTKPTPIGTRRDWRAIATRFNHACALADDDSLWCWGKGGEGQLGQDDPGPTGMDRPTPTQVKTDQDFAMVDTGEGHTCAIRRDHSLWCWGRNSKAILGQPPGSPEQIRHPVQVGKDTDWQLVRSGQSTTCGLRGGLVYCWGEVIDQNLPGSAGLTQVSAPTLIGAPAGAKGLSFNTFGGCSFDAQGKGACWGRNMEGQLGLDDMKDRDGVVVLPIAGWTSLSSGRFYTCGIRSGGLWCAGDNREDQIAQGSVKFVFKFFQVDI